MKPASADVHVLAIHPDMGEEPDGDEGEDASESEGGDEASSLDDAFEAAKDDDKESFIKSMTAAIRACVQKEMKDGY